MSILIAALPLIVAVFVLMVLLELAYRRWADRREP